MPAPTHDPATHPANPAATTHPAPHEPSASRPRTTARLALALLLALVACNPTPATPTPQATDDPAGTLARLAGEPEGPGRKPLVLALRRGPAERVLPVLESGLASPDPALRSAAALATSRRPDGATLAPTLLTLATTDTDTGVRIAATRALANLRHADAFAGLQKNLSHETAVIRLSALRAMARIDPDKAAALPDLARLQLDPDRSVADAATKIARGVAPR